MWPGLGQAYLGRHQLAWMLGMPPTVLAVGVVLIALTVSPLILAAHLFNPQLAIVLTLMFLVLGLMRSVAIFDAIVEGDRRAAAAGVFLVILVVVSHAWLAATTWAFYRAGQSIHEEIAAPGGPGQPIAAPGSPGPTLAPGQTLDPAGTPQPTEQLPPSTPQPSILPGVDERVTVLLVGVDNTHDIERGLTDTLIVSSFDPNTHSLSMVSLPRDVGRLPYYAGGTYMPRVNTLMQAADRNPEQFPHGPMGTLVNEMSYLVGIPIHYYARIDIAGFRALIDAVGGVYINVENAVHDEGYGFSPTEIGFHIEPGFHHLDGKYATAYARSRHGSSDYERARRQQQIILALRDRLSDPSVIASLPSIVDAVSAVIRTNAPLDRLPEILQVALATDSASTRQVVLGPPRFAHRAEDATGGLNELEMFEVRALSIELFGADSLYLQRPAITPRPSDAPDETATPDASAEPTETPRRTDRPRRSSSPEPDETPTTTPSVEATPTPDATRTPRPTRRRRIRRLGDAAV